MFPFRSDPAYGRICIVGRNVEDVYKDSENHGHYGSGVSIPWGWVGVELWVIGLDWIGGFLDNISINHRESLLSLVPSVSVV